MIRNIIQRREREREQLRERSEYTYRHERKRKKEKQREMGKATLTETEKKGGQKGMGIKRKIEERQIAGLGKAGNSREGEENK